MKIRGKQFNSYLLGCAVIALSLAGCQSPERQHKKVLCTLRVHLEARPDGSDRSQSVPVLREQYSGANPGLHLAIFSEFPDPQNEKVALSRWLAAPRISRRIADGILSFTPDATREEAEEIALALNHVAAQIKKDSQW